METLTVLLLALLIIGLLAVYIFTITDIFKSKTLAQRQKSDMIMLIALIPIIGCVLYYLFFRHGKYQFKTRRY